MNRIFKIGIIYLAFLLRGFSFILLAPIYTRALTPATWGGVLAAQSLFLWLTLFIEYGFSLSFTRKVASADSVAERSKLFNSVFSARVILAIPSIFVVLLFSKFGILQNYQELAWFALMMAILQSISPSWYYQAIEKMHVFSVLDSISRVVYIIFSLLLIKSNSDAYKIFLYQSLGSVFTFFVSMYILSRSGITLKLSMKDGFLAIKEGFNLAIYTMITGIYTSLSILILGAFTNPHVVAIYGSGDRLIRAGLSIMGPVNQIILPRSAQAFKEGFSKGVAEFNKILIGYGLGSLIVLIIVFLSAEKAIEILFGSKYIESVGVVHILSILFPIVALNTVLTYHFLVPNNLDFKIVKLYTFASLVSFASMLIFVPRYGAYGMAASVILPEVLVLCLGTIIVMGQIKTRRGNER